MECKWHLCKNTITGMRKVYCSTKCKNKQATDNFRKNQKKKSVEYKGGKCCICGYNRTIEALHFHHTDPNEKDFGIGQNGHTRVWENVKKELDKTVCLCANCHAEIHAGYSVIPDSSVGRAKHC